MTSLPLVQPIKSDTPKDLYSKKVIALIVIVIFTVSVNILISYSKKRGQYTYEPATLIFLSEVIKFLISFVSAHKGGNLENTNLKEHIFSSTFLKFSIPALLYFVQNNLVFYALLYTSPALFIIINQLKTLATGILFRLILKKELTWLQWAALILLTLGTTISNISPKAGETFSISLIGLTLCMMIVWISGSAGVVNEYLMKNVGGGMSESIHIQNMKLYFWGLSFNLVYALQENPDIFRGFNFVAFLITMAYAFSGLAVSAVIKYADVIIKNFATSISMILTSIFSIYFFGTSPTITLFCGIMVIIIALFCYNYESYFLNIK